MSQTVSLWGATYSNVPAITVPKSGGGTASFTDVSDTTAAAADVASGKYFYTAAGVRTQGTSSGGGGTSRLDLITTKSLGTISTSSTSEASINQSIVIDKTDFNDYEIIVVITSVDSVVSNRHVATVGIVTVYGDSDASSKNSAYQPSVKTNYMHNGTKLVSRANNTAYGIYAKGSYSKSKLTLAFYQKYNSSYTGTINGSYTARVYGLKLLDLIS